MLVKGVKQFCKFSTGFDIVREFFEISYPCIDKQFTNFWSALIKQDTLIMEYNPIIEVLNEKTNKQNLYYWV